MRAEGQTMSDEDRPAGSPRNPLPAPPEEWRTKEMPLVAYLATRGIAHVRMEADAGSCYWYFTETDKLHDEVDIFLQGDGRVEPGQFNNNFARIKREMFTFLRGR